MPKSQDLPRHVAIIMDGNGRWAKKKGKLRMFGHRAGVEALYDITRYSGEIGIDTLTVYAFSTENWKRPADEVNALMNLFVETIHKQLDALHENNVRIWAIGARDQWPRAVAKALDYGIEKTKNNTGLRLQLAINYGGRDELLRAFREAAKNGDACESEADMEKYLMTQGGDVDLLIRTGGEQRISNFLLWQCAYAEFVFMEEYWPDFTIEVYRRALDEYAARNRRFGGL